MKDAGSKAALSNACSEGPARDANTKSQELEGVKLGEVQTILDKESRPKPRVLPTQSLPTMVATSDPSRPNSARDRTNMKHKLRRRASTSSGNCAEHELGTEGGEGNALLKARSENAIMSRSQEPAYSLRGGPQQLIPVLDSARNDQVLHRATRSVQDRSHSSGTPLKRFGHGAIQNTPQILSLYSTQNGAANDWEAKAEEEIRLHEIGRSPFSSPCMSGVHQVCNVLIAKCIVLLEVQMNILIRMCFNHGLTWICLFTESQEGVLKT